MADVMLILVCFFFIIDVVIGEYCSRSEYSFLYTGYRRREFYCPFGCCGSYTNEYCCVGHAGYIVGLVFAGIAVLAFIIALICCCIKKSSSKGRMVEPAVITTVSGQQQYDQTSGFVGPNAPPTYSSIAYTTAYSAPAGTMPPPYPYPPQAPLYGQQQAFEQNYSKPPVFDHTYATPASNNYN